MKYENLTLITLNSVLHIKADNLEAVEVDSSCIDELTKFSQKNYISNSLGYLHKTWHDDILIGINISELSDRIFISRKWKPLTDFCNDCGSGTHKNQCDNADSGCIHFTSKAFLLLEKEVKCDGTCADNECICDDLQECLEIVDKKSYSIEEIEKAIDKLPFSQVLRNTIKVDVKNNLKK